MSVYNLVLEDSAGHLDKYFSESVSGAISIQAIHPYQFPVAFNAVLSLRDV